MTFDWNAINAQGPVFWIACGSVALGVAMIAAAAAAQVRRLKAVAPAAVSLEPVPEPVPEAAPASVVRTTIRSGTTTSSARHPATDVHRRRLGELLDRLERVAASLETLDPADFPAQGPDRSSPPPETPLKERSDGVEYVFRAAGG